MTIIPANQLQCGNTREEIINAFCGNLMKRIQKAASEGRHDICFDASAYYHKPTGKVCSDWHNNDGTYTNFKDYDAYKYNFSDYSSEVKEKFRRAGYIIKPTGYIGGVWQLTEDICW
jgi:hypothetical protein